MIKAMDLLRRYDRVEFCAEDAQIVDRVGIVDGDYYEEYFGASLKSGEMKVGKTYFCLFTDELLKGVEPDAVLESIDNGALIYVYEIV